MKYNQLIYLVLLPLALVLSNWILIFYNFEGFDSDLKILLNFNDIEYFPFIISLSEFNFSPSYNDYFEAEGLMTFPYASIILHSIFFKFFGLNGYIISQILFVILSYNLIYYFLKISGISETASILTTLVIFFTPVFLGFLNMLFESSLLIHLKDQIFGNHFNNYRFPRPLVTNLFFYSSLILLILFKKEDNLKLKVYITMSLILSLLLQSFIYLFILVGIGLFYIFLEKYIKNKNFIYENYKKILILFFFFLIFCSPFFLQNLFSNSDYSARMGLYPINLDHKIQLLLKTFEHFFKVRYLIYIVFVLLFFLIFQKKFNDNFKNSFKLYLLLFILSLIIPFIFIIISPYVIWYKHFFDVKNLVFIVGFILIFGFILEKFLLRFLKVNINILLIFFSLSFFLLNIADSNNKIKQKSFNDDYLNDLKKVITLTNKITLSDKFKVFSNSDFINYYLTYKNQNILFPNGFHVSLSDQILELSMINSLKSIGFNTNNLRKFLRNEITWRSYNKISHITGFKYQFNSFYTYFDINDYEKNEIELLENNTLFLSESVALSKNEINNLVNKFNNHILMDEIQPDLVIIDKNIKNLGVNISNKYSNILDTNYFSVLILEN